MEIYLKAIKEQYVPLNPTLFKFDVEQMLCEGLRQSLLARGVVAGPGDGALPACVERHAPGVYSFELFKPEFNQMWLKELLLMKQFLISNNMPSEAPNPKNQHGMYL